MTKPVDEDKEMEKILFRTKKLMNKAYEEGNVNEFTKLSKSFADLSIKRRKFEKEMNALDEQNNLDDPLKYFERL